MPPKPSDKPAASKPAGGDKKPAASKPAGGEKKPAASGSKPAGGDKKPAASASKAAPAKAAAPAKSGDKKGAAPSKAAPAPTKPAASTKSGKGKVTKATGKGKKVAPLPEALKEKTAGEAKKRRRVVKKNPLITKAPKQFGLGGTIQPKRDLGRFVKWPKYVRIQRQRAILKKRLKVPPSINQFTKTLDKNTALKLFKLLGKYRPETKVEKAARLKKLAAQKVENKAAPLNATKKPVTVKYGLNHITALIEAKKASLVVIANDVDPLELVVWLPALCRKLDIPYAIVKSKSRLGTLVHKKNAAAVALTNVRPDDKAELSKLITAIRANFNEKADEIRKSWGGGIMGIKSRTRVARLERSKIREALAKQGI